MTLSPTSNVTNPPVRKRSMEGRILTGSSPSIAHFREGYNEKWPKTGLFCGVSPFGPAGARSRESGFKPLYGEPLVGRTRVRPAQRDPPAFAVFTRPAGQGHFEVHARDVPFLLRGSAGELNDIRLQEIIG